MAFYPIGVSTEKIIERPRIQKWNSLRNTQVRFDSIRFYVNWTLASERCVKACRVTINLKYLTNQELKFSKPLFEAQFMKTLSNIDTEMKKALLIKKACNGEN